MSTSGLTPGQHQPSNNTLKKSDGGEAVLNIEDIFRDTCTSAASKKHRAEVDRDEERSVVQPSSWRLEIGDGENVEVELALHQAVDPFLALLGIDKANRQLPRPAISRRD